MLREAIRDAGAAALMDSASGADPCAKGLHGAATRPPDRAVDPGAEGAGIDEDPSFLQSQLITCLGNKRALLDLVGEGLAVVKERLGKERLDIYDAFSGSGVVSRYFKRHSRRLFSNDLESYARVASACYLANRGDFPGREYEEAFARLSEELGDGAGIDGGAGDAGGIFSRLYAPADDGDIKAGERVFYTRRNALYLDAARRMIGELPRGLQPFFLGPLLSEASVHANTAGVFKGFYKDASTGIGKFGGRKGDALCRILGDIGLERPVLSRFACDVEVLQGDAAEVASRLPDLDVAYLDPPYNQHPYGSNYFMLNLLVDYEEPEAISRVSGIPRNWKRSAYNRAGGAAAALEALVAALRARFVLVSFNSEGFIAQEEMLRLLGRHGKVGVVERKYNAFRGSRNLSGRGLHVSEFLYVLEKA
jgi:adenine-specific DNA-methyltransferase